MTFTDFRGIDVCFQRLKVSVSRLVAVSREPKLLGGWSVNRKLAQCLNPSPVDRGIALLSRCSVL